MTIKKAIEIAKKDKRHEFVRKDVAEMIRKREDGVNTQLMKVSALTAFIIENCFDKRKGNIEPEEILSIIA